MDILLYKCKGCYHGNGMLLIACNHFVTMTASLVRNGRSFSFAELVSGYEYGYRIANNGHKLNHVHKSLLSGA